jgi:DNA-directed RNA polymerase specialized sigma subunit
VTDPRATRRNIAAWVERQVHDEFELIAKSRGKSKGELVRDLIQREVDEQLRVSRIPSTETEHATHRANRR